MFDAMLRKAMDPTLDRWGMRLALKGWTADRITLAFDSDADGVKAAHRAWEAARHSGS